MRLIGHAQPDEAGGEGVIVRLTKREWQFLNRIEQAVQGSTWADEVRQGHEYLHTQSISIDHPLEAIAVWLEGKYAVNQLRRLLDRLDAALGLQEDAKVSPDAPGLSQREASGHEE